jgi:predicted metal-dependent hydrolase
MTEPSPISGDSGAGNEAVNIDLGGREVTLRPRRNRRARHISLRIDAATGGAILVLPLSASLAEGLDFARAKSRWLCANLDSLPQRTPFADGARIPVLGVRHRIAHHPDFASFIWQDNAGATINIGGKGEEVAARVRSWLIEQARREITVRARAKAERLGRPLGSIALRETRTRWGSCSGKHDLAFNWRLIMAPADVLDYVVSHEVAHLRVMNHSPRFWRVVEKLHPGNEEPRAWLRKRGDELWRYG